jgi:uncharacterized protein DUF4232
VGISTGRPFRAWTVLAGASLVALLAGCGSQGGGQGGAGPTSMGGPPVSTGAESSAPPADSASNPPGPAGPAATTRCHTADLRLTTAPDPAANGAGHIGVLLVFTNTSTRTCTMYGYPGVSFVTAENGQQVNDPAQRDSSGGAPTLVTLAPNASAHAAVRMAQPGNFGPACQPVNVAGFRVYPPDETTTLFASSPQQACSAKGVAVPTIRPVQPGAQD